MVLCSFRNSPYLNFPHFGRGATGQSRAYTRTFTAITYCCLIVAAIIHTLPSLRYPISCISPTGPPSRRTTRLFVTNGNGVCLPTYSERPLSQFAVCHVGSYDMSFMLIFLPPFPISKNFFRCLFVSCSSFSPGFVTTLSIYMIID